MMMKSLRKFALCLSAGMLAVPVAAQDLTNFKTGPVFEEFGPHAPVDGAKDIPEGTEFAIAFDVAEKADAGADGKRGRNRGFESAARFFNMHVANGVPAENIKIVIVVHGHAVFDLMKDEALAARELDPNGSGDMVRAMLKYRDGAGVRFIICGQSAAANGIKPDEFMDGVEMELSAMTAHAMLQQDGYTVNPF